MTGWIFKCPECGADVASGWGDSICPILTCGALMIVIQSPPATDNDFERMWDQIENMLGESDQDGDV